MLLRFKVYDFVNWTVREEEREIDLSEIIKHNALLRHLEANMAKTKPKKPGKPKC